jgi:flagellar basal-body rod modification protein FlgD
MNPIANATGGVAQTADKDVAAMSDRLANKEVFMQLLVAQLRYQNPMNPADGAEFIGQLTQFTQLEQTLAIRNDIKAIREAVAPSVEGEQTSNP